MRAHSSTTSKYLQAFLMAQLLTLSACGIPLQNVPFSDSISKLVSDQEEKKGKVTPEDPLCTSFSETYAISDQAKFMALFATKLSADYVAGLANTGGSFDLGTLQKLVVDRLEKESKTRLWLPATLEVSIGEAWHERLLEQDQTQIKAGKKRAIYAESEIPPRQAAAFQKIKDVLPELTKLYPKDGTPYELKLFYVDDPQVQATAVPGGYIYIYRGLLKERDNEQVRLILSHELAHVYKRHFAKQVQSKFIGLVAQGQQFNDMMHKIIENPSDVGTVKQVTTAFGVAALTKEQLRSLMEGATQDQEIQADGCGAATTALVEGTHGCETIHQFVVSEDADTEKSDKLFELEERRNELLSDKDEIGAVQPQTAEHRRQLGKIDAKLKKTEASIKEEEKKLNGLKEKKAALKKQRDAAAEKAAEGKDANATKRVKQLDSQIAKIDLEISAARVSGSPGSLFSWKVAAHPKLDDRIGHMVDAFNAHKTEDMAACKGGLKDST